LLSSSIAYSRRRMLRRRVHRTRKVFTSEPRSSEFLVCFGEFAMNFQVTVLKVLASYPDGFASLNNLKHDMAILATSGRDWTERTKRVAARSPNLDIFSQGLVVRLEDGWRITQRGRSVLETIERP
jgi:hypothetical protein